MVEQRINSEVYRDEEKVRVHINVPRSTINTNGGTEIKNANFKT